MSKKTLVGYDPDDQPNRLVKGHEDTIAIWLSELPEGWTWREADRYTVNNLDQAPAMDELPKPDAAPR